MTQGKLIFVSGLTGAVAAFSSSYEQLNGTAPLPSVVRDSLRTTGVVQNKASGTLAGDIGTMPNLVNALKKTDLKAPTAPSNLTATLNTSKKPVLKWTASTDNVGVANYRIYRAGGLIATVPATSLTYTDSAASAGSKSYYVTALDKAGRVSTRSSTIYITVP